MPIHTIDLNYLDIPQAIAAFVIVGPDGPVLIETGPASTLDHLIKGLAKVGFKLADIHHALVTHIHLDHAGAAGHLARNGTQIYVHEFGAKHLIDPSKLIESATRIYGDQMDRLWGTLLPVPESQITPVHDGDVLDIAGVRIRAIETPGHARHHHAYAIIDDEHSTVNRQPTSTGDAPEHRLANAVCFVGDVAGICVPGVPEPPLGNFLSVPTPPPEFDPVAWHASIERLKQEQFSTIYLTHFGPRVRVAAHFDLLHQLIDDHAEFVRQAMANGQSRDSILRSYIEWNRQAARRGGGAGLSEQDFARYVSTNLLTMNVDGIIRYWSKHNQNAAAKAS